MTAQEAGGQASAGAMGLEELLALPATVNVTTAARTLGISRDKAYALIRSESFPVRTLMLGSTIRVPTAELWKLLGVERQPRGGGENVNDGSDV
ncbi:helix-turn-helix domain-containing protein [Streptomyces sp. PSKA30]|uniref:helix-turn-helix domain-containing protein n=1 Tax=Streptomyces sp. PSKA30 TaxID=2874597 RepID=UPI001CD05A9F|nr:helix-turn-helix domain-containing protein [Streptomyces sp. PSKA30]MBZ9638428.1 helix-turn-helix domain-containing protein [Streptomyces sp. PSKA30]